MYDLPHDLIPFPFNAETLKQITTKIIQNYSPWKTSDLAEQIAVEIELNDEDE